MWMWWPLAWSAGQTTPEGFSLIYFEISKWLTKEEAQRVHREKELSRNEAPSVRLGGGGDDAGGPEASEVPGPTEPLKGDLGAEGLEGPA